MKQINVDNLVTTKVEIEAYYSEYGPNPKIVFSPGMRGEVVHQKVPYVRKHLNRLGAYVEYFCLFTFLSPATNKIETGSIDYCDLELIED